MTVTLTMSFKLISF